MPYASQLNISHLDIDKILKSLNADEYLNLVVIDRKVIELTQEGKNYVEKGTPEF